MAEEGTEQLRMEAAAVAASMAAQHAELVAALRVGTRQSFSFKKIGAGLRKGYFRFYRIPAAPTAFYRFKKITGTRAPLRPCQPSSSLSSLNTVPYCPWPLPLHSPTAPGSCPTAPGSCPCRPAPQRQRQRAAPQARRWRRGASATHWCSQTGSWRARATLTV